MILTLCFTPYKPPPVPSLNKLVSREIEKCLDTSFTSEIPEKQMKKSNVDSAVSRILNRKVTTGLNKAQEGRSGKCIHRSIFLFLGVTDFKLKCQRHMWMEELKKFLHPSLYTEKTEQSIVTSSVKSQGWASSVSRSRLPSRVDAFVLIYEG